MCSIGSRGQQLSFFSLDFCAGLLRDLRANKKKNQKKKNLGDINQAAINNNRASFYISAGLTDNKNTNK